MGSFQWENPQLLPLHVTFVGPICYPVPQSHWHRTRHRVTQPRLDQCPYPRHPYRVLQTPAYPPIIPLVIPPFQPTHITQNTVHSPQSTTHSDPSQNIIQSTIPPSNNIPPPEENNIEPLTFAKFSSLFCILILRPPLPVLGPHARHDLLLFLKLTFPHFSMISLPMITHTPSFQNFPLPTLKLAH